MKTPAQAIHQENLWKSGFFALMKFFLLAPVLLICFLGFGTWNLPQAEAAAGINKQINFQGKLVDNNGVNVADSTYTVVFSLYNVSSGGSNTWTETDSVTTVNGVFQVPLGAVTTLPGSVDFNSDTWYLGIKVGSDAEMTPRVRLTAVPYAFNASQVNGLSVTNNGGNTLNIAANKTFTVNNTITFSGTDSTTMTLPSTTTTLAGLGIAQTFTAAQTIQSNSASALTVGANGTTNPALQIDASAGSSATGVKITSAAAGSGVTLSAISSATSEGLTILAKGDGNILLGQNAGVGNVVVQPNAGGQAALIVNGQGVGDLFTASASGQTKFVVQSGGNVGIGIASPTAPLQVLNTSSGATTIPLIVGNGATGNNTGAKIAFNLSTTNNNITAYIAAVRSNSPGSSATYLSFATNPGPATTEALRLSELGGAGFETSAIGNGAVVINQTNTSGLGDLLSASASGVTKFRLTNAGNAIFNNNQEIDFLDTDNVTARTVLSVNSTGNTFLRNAVAGGRLDIRTQSNVSELTLSDATANAGDIGINTVSPLTSLHVDGGTSKGRAAFIVDQTAVSTNDILTASASGTTKFQLTNGGSLNLVGGQTSDIDTLAAAALKIGASTQNGLTLGRSGAATTINGSGLTIGPTSWTATPTISGLITASTGLTATTGNVTITGGALVLGATTRISNAGVGTFATTSVVGTDTFGTNTITDSGALTIASTTNGLTFNSGNNTITFDSSDTTLSATGLTTITSAATLGFSGDIKVSGNDIQDSGGASAITFDGSQNTTANGNLTLAANKGLIFAVGAGYAALTVKTGTGGSTAGLIMKVDSTASQVITATNTDTNNAVGVAANTVTAGSNVILAVQGVVSAIADNTVTVGDYIGMGSTTGGRAKSLGSTYPTTANIQVLGRALTAAVAGGSFNLLLNGLDNNTGTTGGGCTTCLVQIPTSNTINTSGANYIAPTAASIVGLTINTTTNATTADGLDVITAHTSGTATNGILVNQNAAGTTTNGIQIQQSSGTLTNGLSFSGTIAKDITTGTSNRALTIAPNGTGAVNITSGATTGNGLSVIATSVTQGLAISVTGGTAVTTGGDLYLNGAVYVHTTAETGNLAKLAFTDNSTNTSGATITNGLDIESAFTTTGAGTKTINGLNIAAPTTSSCTTGACSWNGLKITTPATATNLTASALNILAGGVPGADLASISTNGNGVTTAGVNALQITYDGGAANVESGALRVNVNPGSTSGGVWNGFRFVANVTGPATGVTETGVKVEGPATTGGSGTFNGINVTNLLPATNGTVNGVQLATTAVTQSAANTATIHGLFISSVGALNTNTAAGTINWDAENYTAPAATVNFTGSTITENGLKITTGNITQTLGTVAANGINLTLGTLTTGGTQTGINITPSNSNAAGTQNGINIGNVTAGGASETAIKIGSGWDNALSINAGALTLNSNAIDSSGAINIGPTNGTAITIGRSASETVALTLGSDATGDIFYRNSSGFLARLAIGTGSQCLLGGTTPTWGSCSGAAGLVLVPANTAANTVTPTAASTVGLTVNGTNNATTTADAMDINSVPATGLTATNGLFVQQNGAGTTTNGIQIGQTSGTLTNGLTFTGTIANDITTAAARNLTIAPGAGGASTGGGLTVTAGSSTATGGAINITGGAGNSTAGIGGAVTISGGTSTGSVSGNGGLLSLNGGSSSNGNAGGVNIDGGSGSLVPGTISIGGLSAGSINIGTSNSGHTITIGTNTAGTSNTVNINNSTNAGAISLGAGLTTGTITIGGASMSTGSTTIRGGTGTGAITLTPGTAGTIVIGATAGTGAITLGSSTGAQTVNISTGAGGANNQTVNIGTTLSAGAGITTVNIGNTQTSTNGKTAIILKAGNNSGSTTAGNSAGPQMTLGNTASTVALCSSLAAATSPTSGTTYEIRDCSGTPTADYAENYPVAQGATYGDVMAVGTQMVNTYGIDRQASGAVDWNRTIGQITQLVKSSTPYQTNTIGIISDNDDDFSSVGYNLKPEDNPMPIALNGRVLVNIASDSPAIQAGDYLTTSSQLGKAMKATQAGEVIGKALASWTPNSGQTNVMVFVEQGYFNGISQSSVAAGLEGDPSFAQFIANTVSNQLGIAVENGQLVIKAADGSNAITFSKNGDATFAGIVTAKEIRADKISGLDVLTNEISALQSQISSDSASASDSAVLGASTFATPSGTLTLDSLTVNGFATVSGDLRVKGNSLVEGVLTVADTLMGNNIIINGVSDFFGNVVFHSGVTFQKAPAFTPDTAGVATIPSGATTVAVPFSHPYDATPIVNATLTSQGDPQTIFANGYSYVVTNVTPTGFSIVLNKPAVQDVTLSWSALMTTTSSTNSGH